MEACVHYRPVGVWQLDGRLGNRTSSRTHRSSAVRCGAWIALLSLLWPVSAGEFPVGHYGTTIEGVAWEILFDTRLRFLVRREGSVVVEGDYRVEQDRIELGGESGPLACSEAHSAGVYRWSWVGRGMIFVRIEDTCPGRVFAMTGGHWRPDPGGLSVDADSPKTGSNS